MTRKDYPFNKRISKWGDKFVARIITGVIVSPFIIERILSNINVSTNRKFVSKTTTSNERSTNNANIYYIDFIKKLIKETKDSAYNCTRKNYYETISNNNLIHPEIVQLQKIITANQNLLSTNELNQTKRKHCEDIIASSLFEIEKLKSKYHKKQILQTYKEPIITIDKEYHYISQPHLCGYVYFEINKQFNNKNTFYISNEQLLIDKGIIMPNVSKKPLVPLLGKYIQILLYDKFLILSTKNEFVVIGYDEITSSYKNSIIETCFDIGCTSYLSAKNIIQNRSDSSSEIKYEAGKIFTTMEVGVLELVFFSQRVNLVFSKNKEGIRLYNIISKQISLNKLI